jgi:hypothetical protein
VYDRLNSPELIVHLCGLGNPFFTPDSQALCQRYRVFKTLHGAVAGRREKSVGSISNSNQTTAVGGPLW